MNKIKYIICDLDDTLLKKDKTISPKTVEVFKKAKEQGFMLVFNTSRSMQNSMQYIELLKPTYGIYNGGCQIVDENCKDLFVSMVSKEQTKEITKYLNTICDKISVQTHDQFLASDKEYKNQNAIWTDFTDGYEGEAFKILCHSMDHDNIERIAKENNLEFQNYLNRGWHRLSTPGATKWNGVLRFLNVVGGKPEECSCFGDDFGDMEMIEKSGCGVAMANSQPEVLAMAPNITVTNEEDGVAVFIEKNFLK
ncbi:MAG: HAD-IIB family hydrolase [Clostridia bacterium]|nr:HAD-IIB family hydrolase [Clostridia bacterium]